MRGTEKRGISKFAEIVGDGPLRNALEKQIQRAGFDAEVRMVGAVDHEDVLQKITTTNAFVPPFIESKSGDLDGILVVLAETISLGVLTLQTKVSCIRN